MESLDIGSYIYNFHTDIKPEIKLITYADLKQENFPDYLEQEAA